MTDLSIFLLNILNQKPSSKPLTSDEELKLFNLIVEHKLEGYFYPYRHQLISNEAIEHIEFIYKRNSLQNILLKDCFNEINDSCQKLYRFSPTPIKGIDLITWLLSPGQRPMTDIDLLIEPHQLPQFSDVMHRLEFTLRKDTKWFANQHKWTFENTSSSLEMTVEVHTQLIPGKTIHDNRKMIDPKNNRNSLTPEFQVVYLSYHLAHQHTFLKLFWLMDLVKLTQKHPETWSSLVFETAQNLNCLQSVMAVAYILNQYFNAQIQIPNCKIKAKNILTWNFLVHPHQQKWRYYTLKHLIKDRFTESLQYDLGWLNHQFKSVWYSQKNETTEL